MLWVTENGVNPTGRSQYNITTQQRQLALEDGIISVWRQILPKGCFRIGNWINAISVSELIVVN